jgi:hypothetical protein
MSTWFIDYIVRDGKGKPGRVRIPVNGGTVPTAYQTYAGAVAGVMFGAGLMSTGGFIADNLVIPIGTTPVAPQAESEIRNKWQATMQITGPDIFRFSVPAANPDAALIVSGSQIVADLTNTVFSDVLAALIDSGGTVHMQEPDEGTIVSDWGPVLSNTRSRKRPRVGGSR